MNWTNVSTLIKYRIDEYFNKGLYDNNELILLPRYNLSGEIDYEDFSREMAYFLYRSGEINVLTMEESIIILCAFSKYISFDSIFEMLVYIKNKKRIFNKLKKIFTSDYFEKIPYEDGGEYNRCVYCLSDEGIERALHLIPSGLQPCYLLEWQKKKKKKRGYIAHNCYAGMQFISMILTKMGSMYWIERKAGNEQKNIVFFIDILIKIKNDLDLVNYLMIEQDTGSEEPDIIFEKIENYYFANLIGRTDDNKLIFSYKSKINIFIENYFPYLFTTRCIEYVYILIKTLKCDLLMLLCYFVSKTYESSCELRRTKNVEGVHYDRWNFKIENDRVGMITVADFCKWCNYQGHKPAETLIMVAVCARSTYTLLNLPEIEQAFKLVSDDIRLKRENGRAVINENAILAYKTVCKDALCYNPFYIFLKNLYNQAYCTKRKNQLLEYLYYWFSIRVKENNLDIYHKVMLRGTEIFIVPTTLVGEFYPVLLPEAMNYFEAMNTVVNKYFYFAYLEEEQPKPFLKEQENLELYLRNCFTYEITMREGHKKYIGEVYVENTYVSISSLFRVKIYLEKYIAQDMEERNITIICVVNNWNDAVNTALYLDYWEKEDSMSAPQVMTNSGKLCIFKRNFNLCYMDKSELINADTTENPLYMVRRKKMKDGRYAGEGYGYASKKGIYHSQPDGSCIGFYKEVLRAPN